MVIGLASVVMGQLIVIASRGSLLMVLGLDSVVLGQLIVIAL